VPELPQMQALAERLDEWLAGSTFEGADPLGFSGLKTVTPAPETLAGATVRGVGRRGKYLVLDLAGPRVLVHLSQAGRVDLEPSAKRTRPRGAVVRLRFSGGRAVLLREHGTERKAGWWVLADGDDGPLAALGPEPDSPEFARVLCAGDDTRRVHTILRDQHTVAGVGRGYADDALHRARISPYATLRSLDASARERLVEAVRTTLADALARERRREGGLAEAKLGGHFTVHGKAGVPCPECGDDLRRVSFDSHEVVYCATCQTGGKVLADRRLSRLVK
jgi:formamidopyrimidine-DNA glycosylase